MPFQRQNEFENYLINRESLAQQMIDMERIPAIYFRHKRTDSVGMLDCSRWQGGVDMANFPDREVVQVKFNRRLEYRNPGGPGWESLIRMHAMCHPSRHHPITGERVRGYRANYIVADEAASIEYIGGDLNIFQDGDAPEEWGFPAGDRQTEDPIAVPDWPVRRVPVEVE